MNDISEQRPSFYEGEVLGASDLEQLVIYLRDQSARHLLGGHTWGIVAGLQLLEQAAPSGSTDIYLLPGYAIDGYGRAITVVNPLRLDVSAFNGQPDGPVQVWIRYDQGDTSATQPGFQVCCGAGDTYSRVAESYTLLVGDLSLADQQSGITVGGETVDDARTAPQTFDDAAPILCDSSVPYQDLPLADDTKSTWAIPLGEVGWQNGSPGNFVTLTDATDSTKVIHSRRLRRYTGVVAENVYAADNLIRLRRRDSYVVSPTTQAAIDANCGGSSLTDPSHDADLSLCSGEGPMTNELVWIEGKLRIVDDTRILSPGRLELRDINCTSYFPTTTQGSTPLFLKRDEHVTGSNNNADLVIALGKAQKSGTSNRLLVQQASGAAQPDPCQAVTFSTYTTIMAVADGGNVGIGTDSPDQLLEIQNSDTAWIHVSDTKTPADLYVGASDAGGVIATTNKKINDLRFRVGGDDPTDDKYTRMIILPTGQVGIGSSSPDTSQTVTIDDPSAPSILLRDNGGKHDGLFRTDSTGTLLCADTTGDPLILSANGDETGMMWIAKSGNVGIGTPDPQHKLGIQDKAAAEIAMLKTGGPKLVIGADASGTFVDAATDDSLTLMTNDTNRVTITHDGFVGVGTDTPAVQLDVHGDIKLGTAPKYWATGGYVNWVVIAGNIDADGNPISGSAVVGYLGYKVGLGIYRVNYTTPVSTTPVVTIQPVFLSSSPVFNAVPILVQSDGTGFTVNFGWGANFFDYAFNFIALIQRS